MEEVRRMLSDGLVIRDCGWGRLKLERRKGSGEERRGFGTARGRGIAGGMVVAGLRQALRHLGRVGGAWAGMHGGAGEGWPRVPFGPRRADGGGAGGSEHTRVCWRH